MERHRGRSLQSAGCLSDALARVDLFDREIIGLHEVAEFFARDAGQIGQKLIFVLALIAPHGDVGLLGAERGRERTLAGLLLEGFALVGLFLEARVDFGGDFGHGRT